MVEWKTARTRSGVEFGTTLWWLLFLFVVFILRPALLLASDEKGEGDRGNEPEAASIPGAHAFTCFADVFYVWSPHPVKGTPQGEGQGKETVFTATMSADGTSSESARKALERQLPAAKAQALETCRKERQDRGGCLAARLRASGREYQTLDFRSRAALLEALKEDCEHQSGQCFEAIAGEIVCAENDTRITETAQPVEGPASTAEDKKKKKP